MLTHNPTLTLVNGCHINIMMPFWCGKSSSKESKKKMNKESFNKSSCTIPRKFKNASEDNGSCKFGGSRKHCRDAVSGKGFALSKLGSPSAQVSHCQSIPEWPRAQLLPLPRLHQHTDFGINVSLKSEFHSGSKPLLISFLHERVLTRQTQPAGDLATASASSYGSTDSVDPPDSWLLSDNESRNRTAINSPSSLSCCTKHKDQSPVIARSSSKERQNPTNLFFNNDVPPVSADHKPLSAKVKNLQIPAHAGFCTAPDSSTSSPFRIPLKLFGNDHVISPASWTRKQCPEMTLFESGHCRSPGSGQNSGHNSVAADMSGYLFWPQSRCYSDCSPIPSPRMTSPGPSSRAQSSAVTPLRPQAEGVVTELPTNRTDVGKHQQSHRLPLPPVTTSNSCPFPPSHSTVITLSVPRTPGRAESPVSPFSRWKKGRLLGRGSFGHVYLGFNSETGEMCAMKEVTLFSDDAKSKESAQQLGQEIALLSRLQHPNIVQYYGAETFDDKLCIYLEYVSGGSIHKLLQEYGQLGESAIRNYTRQILSGLAYLHAKNTIHRDIKGANILVDPSGRVKLADFGMAKHVIRNSSCCSLAVDIWGLGCTILEMATAKPPWSQYEGVPALYKIGNSKELPAIPEHLSEEAKNFIRQCLQRNPQHRPTAMQLLEHPFVKIASPVERPVLSSDPPQPTPLVYNAASSMEMGHLKNFSCLDSGGADIPLSSGSKITSAPRDAYMPRNISCPVSSIGSPLLHPKSPQQKRGQISPIHNLRGGAPGSSPPHTVGSGTTPWTVLQQPATSLYEGIGVQRC